MNDRFGLHWDCKKKDAVWTNDRFDFVTEKSRGLHER